jgi:hypothetical protein
MSKDGTSLRVNKLLMICHERHEIANEALEKMIDLVERQVVRIGELEKKVELLQANHEALTVASNQFATRLQLEKAKRKECYDCGTEGCCMSCRSKP